jgi:flagellar biosynthesis anti-sigma factor FlgM
MRIDLTQFGSEPDRERAECQQVRGKQRRGFGSGGRRGSNDTYVGHALSSSSVSTAMNSPEIREDKVDSLTQAISSGQYELDPGKIAASMVDEHA